MTEPKPPNQTAIKLVLFAIVLLLGFAAMEVTLRLFPSEISLRVLSKFEPGLRARIAGDLGLRTKLNLREIQTAERTDGGPSIFVPKPLSVSAMKNEPADLDAGALEFAEVDALGFCNAPDLARSAPFDVVMVGDSFTFCTSVAPEDTAAAQLAEVSGLKVYNLGVQGIGPDAYLELLRAHRDRLKPRIVVMNIYEGNDLRDVARFEDFLASGAGVSTQGGPRRAARSYALQFLRANYLVFKERTLRSNNPNKKKINFRYSAQVNGQTLQMNVRNGDRDEVEHAIELRDGTLSYEAFRPSLDAFVDWSAENQVVPILAYVPSMYSAYGTAVVFEDAGVGKIVQKFSTDQRAWFRAFAAENSIDFIDLTPSFNVATAQGVLTHFPGNVHLTPRGHRVVANAVVPLITQLAE